jgi:hypothetical protein
MKFLKVSVAAVLLASVSSFAAMDLTIGGGLNLSNTMLSGDYKMPDGVDKTMLIGFNAGANARFAFNDMMGLVAGLNFETRGMKISEGDLKLTTSANYLQIPVLFSYKLMPELAINIGPEVGIYLSGKGKAEMAGQSVEADLENVSTLDLGASIGVTYTFAEVVQVGGGFYWGFLNTDNDPADADMSGAATNMNIKITVGYLLKM